MSMYCTALDFIFADLSGDHSVWTASGLGSSDHLVVRASFDVSASISKSPVKAPVLQWHAAPWKFIRGELKLALKGWDPARILRPVVELMRL